MDRAHKLQVLKNIFSSHEWLQMEQSMSSLKSKDIKKIQRKHDLGEFLGDVQNAYLSVKKVNRDLDSVRDKTNDKIVAALESRVGKLNGTYHEVLMRTEQLVNTINTSNEDLSISLKEKIQEDLDRLEDIQSGIIEHKKKLLPTSSSSQRAA